LNNVAKYLFKFSLFLVFILLFSKGFSQDFKRINELKIQVEIEVNNNKKADILLELSQLFRASNLDLSWQYALESLTVSKNIHYNKGKIRSYHQLGVLETDKGNYDKAIEYHSNSEKISLDYANQKWIAESKVYLGGVYAQQELYNKSKVYFQDALLIGEKTKSKTIQAEANLALGDLNDRQGKSYLALQYYIIAEEFNLNLNDSEIKGIVYERMGSLYVKTNEPVLALDAYQSSLKVYENKENKNKKKQMELCLKLGMLKENMGDADGSLIYLKTSLGLALEVGDEEFIKTCYQTISSTYEKNEDFKQAYEYLKYFSAIKDTREISQLESQLVLVEQQEKIKKNIEVEKEREKAFKADLENEKFNTRVGYIVAVIILGLSIFLLISLRQRDKINDQLKKATEAANQSRKDKEEFFAYTNHEIRTPLNAVVGMSKILGETNLTDPQQKYLRTITSSAQNILFLVNDVLDLSKIEKGGVEFERIDFSLHEIVLQIIESLSFKKFEKEIEITSSFDDRLPSFLIGDPIRFNQILLNLADNALKFTDKGEVSINLSIIDEIGGKVKVKFEVCDTGLGIHSDRIGNIFDSYIQEHVSTTRQYGGTGLGLSISKLLVEAMGGELKVISQPAVGSNFFFELWMDVSNESVKSSRVIGDTVITTEKLIDTSVLVVDDNQLNREIFRDLLENITNNVTVYMAVNGQDALDKLEEVEIDLVFMDIQMPIMNGYKAAEEIRKNTDSKINKLPILAMTAHVLSGVAEKCIKAGMNDSIAKPINLNLLNQKLRRLLPKEKFQQIDSRKPVIIEKRRGLKHIDLSSLSEMTNNKTEKIAKYVGMVQKNLPVDLEALKRNNTQRNWEGVKSVSHKIKGSLGYIGAEIIVEEIKYLEGLDLESIEEEKINTVTLIVEKEIMLILNELGDLNFNK
jgi:signal transduction histidine kinase/CheY-like chemotaxis protein/HPt (histidine-containing phosphotransfer) domain-containing protein